MIEKRIGDILRERNWKISTAESCTGGMIASLITSVPGSSRYFYGGVISYDNSIKINTLNVSEDTLNTYGAVSKECVEEMAKGVRNLMKTTYAIATSGVAGPDGGTPEKPVGSVWVAVVGDDFVSTKEFRFRGSRKLNIERFSSNAINFMRSEIEKNSK